jgi:prepilin-type N-terminal cleavage/methylation domain-containing protein
VKKMTRNKGFTLIELMVVILIVAILAAVIVPMLRARIDAAKWSEGRAGMGTISTAARAYWAEHQDSIVAATVAPTFAQLFPVTTDLDGKYFNNTCYGITFGTYTTDAVGYTITCTASALARANAPKAPAAMTLAVATDGTSTWTP